MGQVFSFDFLLSESLISSLTSQDCDEDRPGQCQKCSQGLPGQRSRGSGKDNGKPKAGPVYPHAEPAQRGDSDHQLHHGGTVAHALIPV